MPRGSCAGDAPPAQRVREEEATSMPESFRLLNRRHGLKTRDTKTHAGARKRAERRAHVRAVRHIGYAKRTHRDGASRRAQAVAGPWDGAKRRLTCARADVRAC